MKIIAQITAAIFLFLGLVVILLGAYIALANNGDIVQSGAAMGLGLMDFTGLILGAKMLAGGMVALQGLFLSALGEGLWLLAEISSQTGEARDALDALIHRRR